MIDIIFFNGHFFTENPAQPWVEAIAVEGKKFAKVGMNDEILALAEEKTEKIDLDGKVVLPGLIDGHTHPTTIAKTKWHIRIPLTEDKDELMKNIKAAVKANPDAPYLYIENYFTHTFGAEGPRKENLDEIVSDRPCRVQDFGDHACWFNSKALEMLFDENGKLLMDSAMGEPNIVKDAEGEPTGWCMEATPEGDLGIYKATGFYPPKNATEDMVVPFLDAMKAHGVTALFDGYTEGEDSIRLFYNLDKEGKLNMYYHGSVILVEVEELEESITTLKEWKSKYTTDHVTIDAIKFFLDGTNELGDCISLVPFANNPDTPKLKRDEKYYGFGKAGRADIIDILKRLNEEGIDFHVHVIGNGAFNLMCDAVEEAKKKCGDAWKIKVTLAHCEAARFDDQKRAAELGIYIDWSCHWSGGYFGDAAIEFIGMEDWLNMYNFTPYIEAGGRLGLSTDLYTYQEAWRCSPFFGMQIAMTRTETWEPVKLDPQKYPGSFRPRESGKRNLEELLRGYTLNNVERMRVDDKYGSIEEGKYANFLIMNKNIFETPAEEMGTADPVQVYFEGRLMKAEDSLSGTFDR